MTVCSPWSTIASAQTCVNCTAVDPDMLARMLDYSSGVLYELTAQRFPGICTATVFPCSKRIVNDPPIRFENDFIQVGVNALNGARLTGACGCGHGSVCSCDRPGSVSLGGWPIVEVLEVMVDGMVVDSSLYEIDNNRWLVRLPDPDGQHPGWPCCPTGPEPFEVTFTYGEAPPVAGQVAAEILACELALACGPQADLCRLPRNVRSQLRQGVATEFVSLVEFLRIGRTGLLEVDAFIEAYGPNRSTRMPSQIVNPDRHRATRRTRSPLQGS